jgi:hypothetical protein
MTWWWLTQLNKLEAASSLETDLNHQDMSSTLNLEGLGTFVLNYMASHPRRP